MGVNDYKDFWTVRYNFLERGGRKVFSLIRPTTGSAFFCRVSRVVFFSFYRAANGGRIFCPLFLGIKNSIINKRDRGNRHMNRWLDRGPGVIPEALAAVRVLPVSVQSPILFGTWRDIFTDGAVSPECYSTDSPEFA